MVIFRQLGSFFNAYTMPPTNNQTAQSKTPSTVVNHIVCHYFLFARTGLVAGKQAEKKCCRLSAELGRFLLGKRMTVGHRRNLLVAYNQTTPQHQHHSLVCDSSKI
jgi:hypothetical protein